MDGQWEEVVLNGIKDLKEQRNEIDEQMDDLVVKAHSGGVSWERIAEKLGVSRQAVYQHYSKVEGRKKSDEFNKRHGR